MKQETEELLKRALSLPDHERAELAGTLIASLDSNVDPDVDAAWQEEVVRRRHDVLSGKVSTTAWESVQRKARALLNGE